MKLRTLLVWFTIALLGLLISCAGGEQPTEEAAPSAETAATFTVDPATAATITGKVTFTGQPPRRARIRMDAEAVCAQAYSGPVLAEDFVPGEGGTIQNAFVYIKSDFGGASFPVPEEPIELDQKNCLYTPHVIGVMANQPVKIVNSDTVTHNVHPVPQSNREWNRSQPPQGEAIEASFSRPEVLIPVKCNIHPWMRAYIGVMKHPYYAVTGNDGSFTIHNLPPGDYTLVAWQEKLGEKEIQVTVGESETKQVDVQFSGS